MNLRKAKDALEQQLKDPASVQYKNLEKYRDGVVCGEYNAKNSFGGFVGFKQFVFEPPQRLMTEPTETRARIWCSNDPDKQGMYLTDAWQRNQRNCEEFKDKMWCDFAEQDKEALDKYKAAK